MSNLVLVLGAEGFIGRSFSMRAAAHPGLQTFTAEYGREVEVVSTLLSNRQNEQLSIVNLAWPKLNTYSSRRMFVEGVGAPWTDYLLMLKGIAGVASADRSVRFFGIGSGIEGCVESRVVLEPYATYIRQKRQVRDALEDFFGEQLTWLRFHYLFGPHEQRERFIPVALQACRDGRAIMLSRPERRRHWLHVDDAADGLLKAVLHEQPRHWDLCGPHALSFTELCTAVEHAVGRPLYTDDKGMITADAFCPYVEPAEVPDFMPSEAGSLAQIRARLANYAPLVLGDARSK